jgi:hypothetical protein
MKRFFSTFSLLLLTAFMINAQTVNVTFQVDMSVQAAKGAFDPATDQVLLKGDFDGWGAGQTLDDVGGDSVYVGTITVNANSTVFYKFFYSANDTWESLADNRSYDVGDADVTVPVVFFNNEPMPSGNPAPVTFNVDMRVPARAGDFDPSVRSVFVAGSFTDWQNSPIVMEDPEADSIYTVTTDINSAQLVQYKFIYANSSDTSDIQWESIADNRTAWVSDDGTQTYSSFWNDVDPNANLSNGNIEFSVDMSVMSDVGIYDAAADSLHIRGSFNGWGDADRDKAFMSQNFLDPNTWFLQVPFVQTQVGDVQLYKYFVVKADTATKWADGYERPLSVGGSNRPVPFEGTDNQVAPTSYYDDILPNYMIPAGTNVSITFSVDMTAAADPNVQALPFDATQDTVYWICEEPAFTFSQGWTDTDEMRVLVMTDPDNDMVYTGTLNVTSPAWNGFEYRYAYSSPTNGFQAEPSGFGNFAYRVRYVEQDGYQSFVQPYSAPQDHWTAQEDKSDQWEEKPSGVTAVSGSEITPLKFQLSQNYPNPFNPSTAIKFTIAKAGNVTLKVFNVLGQQVSTLINKEMTAGNYDFNFNASALSSGIYFYTLRTGNNVATKKMVLLK